MAPYTEVLAAVTVEVVVLATTLPLILGAAVAWRGCQLLRQRRRAGLSRARRVHRVRTSEAGEDESETTDLAAPTKKPSKGILSEEMVVEM